MNRRTWKTPAPALALVLALWIGGAAVAENEQPAVRIGVLTDGPSLRGFDIVQLLEDEIREVCGGSYAVEFPEDALRDGGWEPGGIAAALDGLLERDDIDVVLAVGVASAAAVCAVEEPGKPVVVPFSFAECNPGCSQSPNVQVNAVGLDRITSRDLEAFREVVPYSNVAVFTELSLIHI